MTKTISTLCKITGAGTFVLGMLVLASCGVPGAGCGDGVVCLQDGATSSDAATAKDVLFGKHAYDDKGVLLEGALVPSLLALSTKMRSFGTTAFTLYEEGTLAATAGYRIIPLGNGDDAELRPAGQRLAASLVDCGITGSVTTRIASCLALNPTSASFSGSAEGLYAETNWSLVTRDTGTNAVVWKDNSTGYIWTAKIADNVSFCKAAGVDQNYSYDCGVDNDATKLTYCAERSNFTVPTPNGLGGIDKAGTKVTWRLPTRADFLKAELDGLRYVQELSGADSFWSANTWVEDPGSAWILVGDGSLVTKDITDLSTDVLCVGVEAVQE